MQRRLLEPRGRKNAALFLASWGLTVGCGVWAFGRFRTPVCPELPYSSFFRLAQVKKIERVAFEEAARAGAPHWVYFNVKKRVDLAKELGVQVEGKAGPFRARRPGPTRLRFGSRSAPVHPDLGTTTRVDTVVPPGS